MKAIVLLATALYLASAPSPDSKAISEMSAGFLSLNTVEPLLAADSAWPTQDVRPEFMVGAAVVAIQSQNQIQKVTESVNTPHSVQ